MNPSEAYILEQKEPFKSILLHLQILVTHTLPEAEMKYKWRIPFYYIGKCPICFFNQTKDYVDVGFWHSAHLTKYHEYLVSDKRKVVKSLRYKRLDDIDDGIFIFILKQADLHKEKAF